MSFYPVLELPYLYSFTSPTKLALMLIPTNGGLRLLDYCKVEIITQQISTEMITVIYLKLKILHFLIILLLYFFLTKLQNSYSSLNLINSSILR